MRLRVRRKGNRMRFRGWTIDIKMRLRRLGKSWNKFRSRQMKYKNN